MGWFNVTSLQSALALVEEIPPDLPHEDWVRSLITDHRELAQKWEEWREEQDAKEDSYYNERQVRGQQVKEGDLVLLHKAELERKAGSKLLPRADGPYEVASKPNEHTVTLKDPRSGAPVLEGRPQPVNRIIQFHFPKELMQPVGSERDSEELEHDVMKMTEAEALLLHGNDVVCYEEEEDGEASAGLIIVDAIHADQRAVSGRALRAVGQGPWKDRTWQIDVTAYQAHRAQVGFGRLLCRVELENAKLSGGSVESMRKSGVVL